MGLGWTPPTNWRVAVQANTSEEEEERRTGFAVVGWALDHVLLARQDSICLQVLIQSLGYSAWVDTEKCMN